MASGKGCFKCRLNTRRGNGVEVEGFTAMRASSSGSSQHLQVTPAESFFIGEDKVPGRYSGSCQGHRFSKRRSWDLNLGFFVTSLVLCSTIAMSGHILSSQQVLKELWEMVFSQFRCHRDLRWCSLDDVGILQSLQVLGNSRVRFSNCIRWSVGDGDTAVDLISSQRSKVTALFFA